MKNILVIVALLLTTFVQAQVKKTIGTSDFSDWSGISKQGENGATFKSGDTISYPLGDESSRRKTLAVRTQGKTTRYLSVVEPYENESVIKSVTAKSANELVVELKDGRIQEITISNLDNETNPIKVAVRELLNGKVVRQEETN